jgi:hypothetical protein
MNVKQRDAILLANPTASLDELLQKTGNCFNRDSLRKRRVQLNLPPFKLTKQNADRANTFSSGLLESGFDGENWSHGWLKKDGMSIFIRNKDGFVTYDDMKEELISEMKSHAPKYPKVKRNKIKDGHLLVVDPADIHLGKLALAEEVGEDYNVAKAKQRCLDGVDGLLEKASGFPVEMIHLIIGNDILHTDGTTHRTTKGTEVDGDTLWWKAFREAKDLYVQIIEKLIPIAPVTVIYCPSNHDLVAGFFLADTLASWFSKSDVKFFIEPSHRKYFDYGLNMLGYDHGDGAKDKDAKDLMADEEPQMWGRTKFRYVYKHHLHHKKKLVWRDGEDHIGITVEYLRSPSPADGWHQKKGFVSQKAVEAFIHHRTNGQVARLVHYF